MRTQSRRVELPEEYSQTEAEAQRAQDDPTTTTRARLSEYRNALNKAKMIKEEADKRKAEADKREAAKAAQLHKLIENELPFKAKEAWDYAQHAKAQGMCVADADVIIKEVKDMMAFRSCCWHSCEDPLERPLLPQLPTHNERMKFLDKARDASGRLDAIRNALSGKHLSLVDAQPLNQYGGPRYSALHQAAEAGQFDSVQYLLHKCGADHGLVIIGNAASNDPDQWKLLTAEDLASDPRIKKLLQDHSLQYALVSEQFPAVGGPGNEEKSWCKLLDTCMYDSHVAKIANDILQHHPGTKRKTVLEAVPLSCCVGPATKLALYASVFTWGLFLIFPWVVLHVHGVHCTYNTEKAQDFANVYRWVPFSCLVPVLIFTYTDYKIMKFVIIQQLQVSGTLDFLGMPLSCSKWLFVTFCQSVVGHMDLFSNGIFLALSLATYRNSCTAHVHIDCIWKQVMLESAFSHIPGLVNNFQPKFYWLVLWMWLLTFLQAFYGWFHALPVSILKSFCDFLRCPGVYKRLEQFMEWVPPERFPVYYKEATFAGTLDFMANNSIGDGFYYQTVTDSGEHSFSGHGDVLFAMADSCRLAFVNQQRSKYTSIKATFYLESKQQGPLFGILKRELNSKIYNVMLQSVFVGGFQLNLQISMLGMTSSYVHFVPKVVLASVMCSALFALRNLVIISRACLSMRSHLSGFAEWLHLPEYTKWLHLPTMSPQGLCVFFLSIIKPWRTTVGDEGLTETRQIKQLLRRYQVVVLALFFYVLLIFYAFLKIGALFVCPNSLYNLTGCATIDETCARLD